jgi:hypothetical protein
MRFVRLAVLSLLSLWHLSAAATRSRSERRSNSGTTHGASSGSRMLFY